MASLLNLGLLVVLALVVRGIYLMWRNKQLRAAQAAQREARQLQVMRDYFKTQKETEMQEDTTPHPQSQPETPLKTAPLKSEPVVSSPTKSFNAGIDVKQILNEVENKLLYGKFDEAARLLQRAINKMPQQVDLRLKLVEIHLTTGNEAGLTQQELDIMALGDQQAIDYCQQLIASRGGNEAEAAG